MNPDRDPPPWKFVRWTTLEALEREHKRLQQQVHAGVPDRKRSDAEWREHLAEVLPIRTVERSE